MADWASLNGQRIVSATISIPYYGAWVADVVLSVATSIGTTVSLTFADVTLAGAVYRQFSFAGSRSARIVGGAGNWQDTVKSRSYQNAGGVPVLTVLNDLAIDVGETIGKATQNALQGQALGTAFVREGGSTSSPMPASRILKQVGGPIWWVDSTGATQMLDRAILPYSGSTSDTKHLGAITSQFNVIEWSGAKGRFVIASETLSDWMPGRTFSDSNVTTVQTIGMVTHTFDGAGKARSVVLATP